MKNSNFQFHGSAGDYLGNYIIAFFTIAFTVGIGTPWAVVRMQRWKARYTTINGQSLEFHGEGSDLFGKWIIWTLLTLITAGIYMLWAKPAMTKWLVENTDFKGA